MSKSDSKVLEYLVRDDNNVAVPIGSAFQTTDNTSPEVTSPYTYTTAVTTIVVPDRAVELILAPTTALRVSELSAVTNYYVITAGSAETFPCARMQNIYIRGDAAGGTLNFRFVLV